jgi:hypothetical protein
MFFHTLFVSVLMAASGTQAIVNPQSPLEARVEFPNPSVNCHDWTMSVSEYQKAVSQLGSTCDGGTNVLKNSVFYNTFGSAKAFVCNWGSGPQGCSHQEMDEAIKLIDEKCGNDKAGWVQIDKWAKQYGRTTTSDHPCPNLNG